VEAISSSPYVLKQYSWGQRMQHGEVKDTVWETLDDAIHSLMMGETAALLAILYLVQRKEQDELALLSHKRAQHAIEKGYFENEIVPIKVKSRREERTITTDENPRANLTLEKLANMQPAFVKGGTVTAGNSSSLNDGSAA